MFYHKSQAHEPYAWFFILSYAHMYLDLCGKNITTTTGNLPHFEYAGR